MRDWDAERIAAAAGARLIAPGRAASGPLRATIDSRQSGAGDLFIGLPGSRFDGGRFAADVLAAGAWGAIVGEDWAGIDAHDRALLVAYDPLAALARLARAWRRELDCTVIAITGSTGKTSTKDLTAAMLAAARRTVATHENLNTEIGLPLTILAAPPATEILVLELAMRGAGQIAELAAICEPNIGVIVNVGPVHLELLGSVAAVAAAKAELIEQMATGSTVIVPADEPLLDLHLRSDLTTVTFGQGGDVERLPATIAIDLTSAHMRSNALAALAAARAAGVEPSGRIDVRLSALRGQRSSLAEGVELIDDCYNANPMSMRAALEDLQRTTASRHGRKIAVLGEMLELGTDERRLHREVGGVAERCAVDLLITVGARARWVAERFGGEQHHVGDAAAAADLLGSLLAAGDTVLIKGSRGVGLEIVGDRLRRLKA